MEALFLGTVISFKKQKGFGHIEPDDKAKFGDKVFCHWKTIQTSEKWPTLTDGMRVAFQAERDGRNLDQWKTTEVYRENGEEIKANEELTLLEKGKKYRGSCKSYNKGTGEGLIIPDGDGPWLKKGVRVLRSDISGDGGTPSLKRRLRVQFQITKEKTGYRAIDVTLPGGRKVPTEGGNKADEGEVNKSQKGGGARKRPFSKVAENKNLPTTKKNKKDATYITFSGHKIKRTQLSSGSYGGMEIINDDVVEVGLLMRNQWVGSLIGKKGVTINEVTRLSEAKLKFGDEDIEVNGGMYNVLAVNGTMNQVSDACKMITNTLGEVAQTLEFKIVFLVPDQYCGTFVGKKGSTINEIRGEQDQGVRVILGQEPITLPGPVKITLCSLFGPRENVQDAIERTVAVLGAISARLKRPMDTMEWGGGWSNDGIRGNKRNGWRGRPW